MPTELLLIHATGVCALALNVSALVRGCERALRLQSGLSGALWALNNLLLGAHTAAALSLVSAGRTATSAVTLQAADRVRHAACTAFMALTLAVTAFTWNGWPSALLLVASLLSTFAVFYLRAMRLRLTMLLVSALWMVNAWQHDSWEQMLANVITALAALYGAQRNGSITATPPPRTSTARSSAAGSAS
ncbi:MAG TPA: YgjV family protein [Burkholderiaceae bacterium]